MSSFCVYIYPDDELRNSKKDLQKIISTIKVNAIHEDVEHGYRPESITYIEDVNTFSVEYGIVKPIDILTLDGTKTIEQLRLVKSMILFDEGLIAYSSTTREDLLTIKNTIEDLLGIDVNPNPLHLTEAQARNIKDEAEEIRSLQTKKIAGAEWAAGSGREFEHTPLSEFIDPGELYSFKFQVSRINGVENPVVFGIKLYSKPQTPTTFTIFTRGLTPEEEAISTHHLLTKHVMPKYQRLRRFQKKLPTIKTPRKKNEGGE